MLDKAKALPETPPDSAERFEKHAAHDLMTTPLYSRLIITSGNHAGKVFSLVGRSILVGRRVKTPGWDIRLTDETVSRQHARLEFVDGRWAVFDLHSANGTRVNEQRVSEAGSALQTGDVLEFGEVRAVFERYDGHLATTRSLGTRRGTDSTRIPSSES